MTSISTRTARRLLAPLTVVLLAAACGDDEVDELGEPTATTQEEAAVNPPETTTTQAVGGDQGAFFRSPAEFVGQQVTASGEVVSIVDGRAFRLASEDGVGETVTVFSTPIPGLDQGDLVQVDGVVRDVRRDGFREDFGTDYVDAYGAFGDAPAIAASSAHVYQEYERPATTGGAGAGTSTTTGG